MKVLSYLIIVLFFFFNIIVNAEAQDYKDYSSLLKERCKISVSFPNDLIDYESSTITPYFCFDNSQSLPRFYYGPIINMTDNCSVILMDIEKHNQPQFAIDQLITYNYYPDAIGWMFQNCDLPWNRWFYTPPGGLPGQSDLQNTENSSIKLPTGREREELIKKAILLRQEYETEIENNELTKKTNCSIIFIVKIPNIERVYSSDELLCNKLKKNSTDCYGVEFYKKTTHIGFKMLFFINDKEKESIVDYIETVSQFLSFE